MNICAIANATKETGEQIVSEESDGRETDAIAEKSMEEDVDMLLFSPLAMSADATQHIYEDAASEESAWRDYGKRYENDRAGDLMTKNESEACVDNSMIEIEKVLRECVEIVHNLIQNGMEMGENAGLASFTMDFSDLSEDTNEIEFTVAEWNTAADPIHISSHLDPFVPSQAPIILEANDDKLEDVMEDFAEFDQNTAFDDFGIGNECDFNDTFTPNAQETIPIRKQSFADFETECRNTFKADWELFVQKFPEHDYHCLKDMYQDVETVSNMPLSKHPAIYMYREQTISRPKVVEKVFASYQFSFGSEEIVASRDVPPFETTCLRILQRNLFEKIQNMKRYKVDCDGSTNAPSNLLEYSAQVLDNSQKILDRNIPKESDLKQLEDAISSIQSTLFEQSVHEAIMQIAKHAALSAEAKIAEQFAQQSTTRTSSSLLASFQSTRQLLGRGHSNGSIAQPTKSSQDQRKAPYSNENRRYTLSPVHSIQTETPTAASTHKMSRQGGASHPNTYSIASKLFRHRGQEEDGGSAVPMDGLSGDESESSSRSSAESRTQNPREERQSLSSSDMDFAQEPVAESLMQNAASGGLIRKFASSILSSATSSSHYSEKSRRRCVKLRAMHPNGETKSFQIDLDEISGGFDEVKWKCAGFLYDLEDVLHIAPSQIRVWAHPSQQLLAGKSQKSIFSKFFKSHAVWTIDIGTSSQPSDDLTQ